VVGDLNAIGYSIDGVAAVVQDIFGDSEYQVLDAYSENNDDSAYLASVIAQYFNNNSTYWLSTSDPWNYYIPLFLDISGASTSPGAPAIQWTWNGNLNQDWYVVPTNSGYAEIVNANSGQCLSVAGNSTNPGTPLIQWPCWGGYGQQWLIGSGTNPGWSESGWDAGIESRLNPGQNVDVYGASPEAGATIDQWSWNGGWNQWWSFTYTGS
jgi:Ricin-type beta-trefoil lectin domain-like